MPDITFIPQPQKSPADISAFWIIIIIIIVVFLLFLFFCRSCPPLLSIIYDDDDVDDDGNKGDGDYYHDVGFSVSVALYFALAFAVSLKNLCPILSLHSFDSIYLLAHILCV